MSVNLQTKVWISHDSDFKDRKFCSSVILLIWKEWGGTFGRYFIFFWDKILKTKKQNSFYAFRIIYFAPNLRTPLPPWIISHSNSKCSGCWIAPNLPDFHSVVIIMLDCVPSGVQKQHWQSSYWFDARGVATPRILSKWSISDARRPRK